MRLAEGIRRIGFRKWYERQLMKSHGYLAFTFICMVAVLGALESMRSTGSWAERAGGLLTAVLCVGAGLWALRRYLHLLQHAEFAAHQAECPQCKVYGRLELVQSDVTGERVLVRCRACAHGWRIEM